ncbi:TetR family transcriptional regulator [Sphingobium phenoxybenzoativorans]|uniref:TetR family transcriptional regulator n=1 Tax=Sphingobium phenoxybenzoativorans TaxID=1592790 RepID=A0A975Q0B4_9SPHN|nr:TetR/AcrR family transcriptional regulator [Sphingobium phenoxybenzoativorans]QUT04137.1 TetR family transcriptional regulator [Sphingobium phenoxybenzoativorans]
MPPPVDHEARRRHIAEIAADLIAEGGLDQATVRKVSAAAGYSTAVVSHYFADKRELLLLAYRAAAQETQRRFDAARAKDPRDLTGALEAFLPIDAQSARAWRVYFAFWSVTASDPELAAEQKWWLANARRIIGETVRDRFGMRDDLEMCAQSLLIMMQGLAVQAVFDQDQWTADKQHAFLETQVRLITGEAQNQ